MGDWTNWPEFRRLEAAGLIMYGQMTAGSWIYIGTQGILQGTYDPGLGVLRHIDSGDAPHGEATLEEHAEGGVRLPSW